MAHKTLFSLLILLSLLFTGCSSLQPEPTSTPTETPVPPTPTSTPTITPSPTTTPSPTPTLTPTPLSTTDILSKNFIEMIDVYGVEIELTRVLVAEKDILLQDHPQLKDENIRPANFSAPIFDDKPVVLELFFRMTNTSERIYTIWFYDTFVQVNGKQSKFEEFIDNDAVIADNINTWTIDILPGSTISIGIWVGLEATDVSEISQINILMDSPSYELADGSYMSVGRKYYFSLDLTEWGFEPFPAEIMENLY